MGTNFIRTNENVYAISTSRLLLIPTGGFTNVVMIHSASLGMVVCNVGNSVLAWADSGGASGGVSASTGGLLYYSMIKEWVPVRNGFNIAFATDATNGQLMVMEYKA